MRMRLLLLGGGNCLGQALIRQGAEENIDFLSPKPPAQSWDTASLTALLDETRPNAVINLAYYFDWFQAQAVDPARLAAQEAVVERLAGLCGHLGAILLQPSSYRVFSGDRATPYQERDLVSPLGPRGHSFVALEQAVRARCSRHILLRLGWLLDESSGGQVDRLLRLAAKKPLVWLADDRRGNPTPVDDAARVLLAILKQLDCTTPLWGTYQYGGQESTTPLLLGQALVAEVKAFIAEPYPQITAKRHDAQSDTAEEPQYAVLACQKILHTFGVKPRAWRNGLYALVDRYYRRRL